MGGEEGQEDCAVGAVAWEVSAEAPCPLRPTPLFAGAEAPAGVLHPASRILNFNRFLFPQPFCPGAWRMLTALQVFPCSSPPKSFGKSRIFPLLLPLLSTSI